MEHWNEVLPGRILTVRYEDMVRQPVETVVKVMKKLDLKMNEATDWNLDLHQHELGKAARYPAFSDALASSVSSLR